MEKEAVERLVNKAIGEHCLNDDKKHAEILKVITDFTEKANPVIDAFNNYSTTGQMASRILFTTAKIVIAIGTIMGVVLAVKEWLKK